MLKRSQIRPAIVAVLLDPTTRNSPACGDGALTNAGTRIADTPIDPQSAIDSKVTLPYAAVYTESEISTPRSEHNPNCFESRVDLIVEFFDCSASGRELEEQLDELEYQVKFKILTSNALYKLGKLESVQASTVRDSGGVRVGLRRVVFTLAISEKFVLDVCEPKFNHKYNEVKPNG
ncbi:MAG: hypothetical protein ACRBHB_18110 [Arenicella sp.]